MRAGGDIFLSRESINFFPRADKELTRAGFKSHENRSRNRSEGDRDMLPSGRNRADDGAVASVHARGSRLARARASRERSGTAIVQVV